MPKLPEYLERVMEYELRGYNPPWQRDRRGLMPLAYARKAIARWRKRPIMNGFFSSEYWAALVSLADAAEFLRTVKGARWSKQPTGTDRVAPALRYGEAILPWLASFVDKRGVIAKHAIDVEWNLVSIGGPRALEVLLRIASDRTEVIEDFIDTHRKAAYRAFDELSRGGNVRAREVLLAFVAAAPSRRRKELAAALGARASAALLAGASGALEAGAILKVLDAAAIADSDHRLDWPDFEAYASNFTYHAMRVIAARSRTGDDWGIVFEVVLGDLPGRPPRVRWPAAIQQFYYGSRVRSGGSYLEDARPLRVPKAAVTSREIERLDLRPRMAGREPPDSWPFVLAVRAALARDRAAFWNSPAMAIEALDLGPRAQIIVACDAFAHVVGRGHGKPVGLPSKSPTYRSIARAIVDRDPARFDPGKPNTDWRLWATHRDRR